MRQEGWREMVRHGAVVLLAGVLLALCVLGGVALVVDGARRQEQTAGRW